jgi:spore coat protein U-like protein
MTYNVGLDAGTSSGATINARKMASGANSLNYQLYSDAARSTIWGNTTGTDTVTGSGTGLAVDHTVFGAVPAAQLVPAGDYADTITVRVYY